MTIRSPSSAAATPVACAPFRALLLLAPAHLLDARQQARLDAHLAVCARCQAELAVHERMDRGLRQLERSHGQVMVPFTAQQIARAAASPASARIPHTRRARQTNPPAHRRGILARVAPYGAVAALVILALALFGISGRSRGFIPGGTSGGAIDKATQLTGIAMLSPDAGWAIGSDASDRPALFHYTGDQWRAVGLPAGIPANATLHGIAMLSDTEGWAVGGAFASGPAVGTATPTAPVNGLAIGRIPGATSVLLHESGGQWSMVQPTFAADLTQVVMRTASDGWAVGITGDRQGTLLHYDGTSWGQVQSPAFADLELNGVSAVAADDVWLVGRLHDASSAILHYDGTTWQRQAGLDLSEAALSSIQMVSASEGWAVGGYCTCKHALDVPTRMLSGALILHYHAGVWTFQTSSQPDRYLGDLLLAVAMVSPTEGWAVGEGSTILHYSLGSWSPAASPSHLPPGATHVSPALTAISMLSARQGWAVGDQGTLIRFNNGDWEAV